MKVPLSVPNLSGREADYLLECIRSTFVSTTGPFVSEFEELIASWSGTESAISTCTGTVALQMALEALGVGEGDLVIVPALTFIATANAVRHSGAQVWLVDSTTSDWTLDLSKARQVIEAETDPHPDGRVHRGTGLILKAIMPVMIMGSSLDFTAYMKLAATYGLKVVVDAAAAIGATGPGDVPLGATGVDAVCYSFNGNKTITSGGGGAIASTDDDLISRIRHLISTARIGSAYDHDEVGYNFRMTNVEAAIGVAQIEQLPKFLARKRAIFERYEVVAAGHPHLEAFPTPTVGRSVHWFSGLHYTGPDLPLCDLFRSEMNSRGIETRSFWRPIHQQRPYVNALRTNMDVVEGLWDRIIPLPSSTGITDKELEFVAECADDFWSAVASHG